MYIAHLSLESFLEEAGRDMTNGGKHEIRLQTSTTSSQTGHGTQMRKTGIFLSSKPLDELHIARIEVERLEIWVTPDGRDHQLVEQAARRSEQARELVVARIRSVLPEIRIGSGIALLPGMSFEAYRETHTDQDLWRIKQPDRDDPSTRALVVREAEDAT